MPGHQFLQGIAHLRIFCLPARRAELPARFLDGTIGVAVFECGGDVMLGL